MSGAVPIQARFEDKNKRLIKNLMETGKKLIKLSLKNG